MSRFHWIHYHITHLAEGIRRWSVQRGFDVLGKGQAIFNQNPWFDSDLSQLTDWLAHVPKSVIAKNFHANISAFDHIPAKELYIFPSGMS